MAKASTRAVGAIPPTRRYGSYPKLFRQQQMLSPQCELRMVREPVTISKETSRRMAVMSFVCACMIVAIHCTPCPPLDSWQWWIANLLGADGLCRIAVPWFFVASGFFFAGHFGEDEWYGYEVLKRVKTLIIPFVLWALIGILFAWCMWYGIQKAGYACNVRNPFENGVGAGIAYALGFDVARMNIGPIWYLRMLFVLVVLSPVLYWCLRRSGYLLLVVVSACYGIYDTFVHFSDFWEYVFSLRGLAYFSVGIAIRTAVIGRVDKMSNCLKRCIFMSGLGMLILNAFARNRGLELVENTMDFLMVPLLMFGMWTAMKGLRLPTWCVQQSFAVYVLHGMCLHISIAIIVTLQLREFMDVSLSVAAGRWLFAMCCSISISLAIKRYAASVATVLFGGR